MAEADDRASSETTGPSPAALYLGAGEAWFQTFFDQSPVPIVVLSPEAGILAINDAACALIGYSRDEILRNPFGIWMPPEYAEAGLEHFHRAAAGEKQSYTSEVIHRSGRRIPIAATNMPVIVDGKMIGVYAVAQDLTEQRRIEQEREAFARSDKLRALGQMAGGIAHDLNQQFALVSGYGDLAGRIVAERFGDDSEVGEMIRIMTQAATDGGEIVKRLLTFARGQSEGPAEPVDLGEILHEVARLTAPRWRDQAQAEGRPISLIVESSVPAPIEGWPHAIREAITNLVFNSVDALPRGGTIRLGARHEGDGVVVEVADTGTGMTEEVQARLFEPFFTTKGEAGTGLGLPSVYGIMQQHQGTITVASAPGRGTVFTLRFPPRRMQVGEPPRPDTAGSTGSYRVLVVEDEPALRTMVTSMLHLDGHQVISVGSGEEALAALAAGTVDLVLTDVGLGAGMNGWQLVDLVRAAYPAVRIVVASGWGTPIDATEARERGIAAMLPKPYRLAQLRTTLADILD